MQTIEELIIFLTALCKAVLWNESTAKTLLPWLINNVTASVKPLAAANIKGVLKQRKHFIKKKTSLKKKKKHFIKKEKKNTSLKKGKKGGKFGIQNKMLLNKPFLRI